MLCGQDTEFLYVKAGGTVQNPSASTTDFIRRVMDPISDRM